MNYTSGDYLMLYESLANCDWACVYNQTSVDLAVDSLNAVVTKATAQAVPISYSYTNKFPHWLLWYVKILY
jgi:aminoglycoside N3'-acetyltransferase